MTPWYHGFVRIKKNPSRKLGHNIHNLRSSQMYTSTISYLAFEWQDNEYIPHMEEEQYCMLCSGFHEGSNCQRNDGDE